MKRIDGLNWAFHSGGGIILDDFGQDLSFARVVSEAGIESYKVSRDKSETVVRSIEELRSVAAKLLEATNP